MGKNKIKHFVNENHEGFLIKCTEYSCDNFRNKINTMIWYVKIIKACLLNYEQLKFVLKEGKRINDSISVALLFIFILFHLAQIYL